jgi:hypothetical protein
LLFWQVLPELQSPSPQQAPSPFTQVFMAPVPQVRLPLGHSQALEPLQTWPPVHWLESQQPPLGMQVLLLAQKSSLPALQQLLAWALGTQWGLPSGLSWPHLNSPAQQALLSTQTPPPQCFFPGQQSARLETHRS